jgi:hypothetical protein
VVQGTLGRARAAGEEWVWGMRHETSNLACPGAPVSLWAARP